MHVPPSPPKQAHPVSRFSPPGAQLHNCEPYMQDSEVGFDIDLPITGDITLGLWFGDHKVRWDPPELACSFHTLFDDTGVLRMGARDLDIPPGSALGRSSIWQADFFMDIIVEESTATQSAAQCVPAWPRVFSGQYQSSNVQLKQVT